MRVRHPDGDTHTVDVRGDLVHLDDSGEFDAPEPWVERWCEANDYAIDDVRVANTCQTIKSDGEVCGRELPCPYHTDAEE